MLRLGDVTVFCKSRKIFPQPDIDIMVRVFTNGPGRPEFNPKSSYERLKKWYSIPP